MKAEQIQAISFVSLLFISTYLFIGIILPYLTIVVVTIALAVLFYPLYINILSGIKNPTISSLVTLLLVFLLIIIPVLFFGRLLAYQSIEFFSNLEGGWSGGLDRLIASFQRFFPDLDLDASNFSREAINYVTQNISGLFSSAIHVVASMFVGSILFFYLLKDGEMFLRRIVNTSPLGKINTQKILKKFEVIIRSVIKGNILMALAQGVLTGVGFVIFGVPNPVLWSAVTTIAALVPFLGTTLILLGGIVYLYFSSTILATIGLVIWSVVLVGTIDDILRPYVIGRGTNIHPMLVLLSVLGGVVAYGPIGFILGPIIMSLFIVVFEIFSLARSSESI